MADLRERDEFMTEDNSEVANDIAEELWGKRPNNFHEWVSIIETKLSYYGYHKLIIRKKK